MTAEFDLACDFAEHLSQRLGLSRGNAERQLAQWVAEYEPKAGRRFTALSSADREPAPARDAELTRALIRVA